MFVVVVTCESAEFGKLTRYYDPKGRLDKWSAYKKYVKTAYASQQEAYTAIEEARQLPTPYRPFPWPLEAIYTVESFQPSQITAKTGPPVDYQAVRRVDVASRSLITVAGPFWRFASLRKLFSRFARLLS